MHIRTCSGANGAIRETSLNRFVGQPARALRDPWAEHRVRPKHTFQTLAANFTVLSFRPETPGPVGALGAARSRTVLHEELPCYLPLTAFLISRLCRGGILNLTRDTLYRIHRACPAANVPQCPLVSLLKWLGSNGFDYTACDRITANANIT